MGTHGLVGSTTLQQLGMYFRQESWCCLLPTGGFPSLHRPQDENILFYSIRRAAKVLPPLAGPGLKQDVPILSQVQTYGCQHT